MRFQSPDHPLDSLSAKDKCDIYFSKVVDLAVLSGLLAPDSTTEIGHFAFSSHYVRGKQLGTELLVSLAEFRERYPEHALARRISQNEKYLGVVEQYHDSSDEEKVRDLILLGASYRIWPTGTSFTLTYPWDLEGRGRPVRFRDDLSRFMKRRILAILREAGKLHNPYLFGSSIPSEGGGLIRFIPESRYSPIDISEQGSAMQQWPLWGTGCNGV